MLSFFIIKKSDSPTRSGEQNSDYSILCVMSNSHGYRQHQKIPT